jgi:hypothetical protein
VRSGPGSGLAGGKLDGVYHREVNLRSGNVIEVVCEESSCP